MASDSLRAESKLATIVNEAQRALLAAGVRGARLAKICGVSPKSASRWLRGEKTPDEVNAARISAALDVAPEHWRCAPGEIPRATSGHVVTPRLTQRLTSDQERPYVPPDWARRPGEARIHLFARRIAWHAARDAAARADVAPPALTSDVDPEDVARRVARYESAMLR